MMDNYHQKKKKRIKVLPNTLCIFVMVLQVPYLCSQLPFNFFLTYRIAALKLHLKLVNTLGKAGFCLKEMVYVMVFLAMDISYIIYTGLMTNWP